MLWKVDDTSLVTPRVAQWVHGATAAHLGLSAVEGTRLVLVSMDQQVVGGQHEHVGIGTHGERDRDGREP